MRRSANLRGRVTPPRCAACGQLPTPEGHDACLGTLPGVWNACCGHGDPSEAYVQFRPGVLRWLMRKLGLMDARRIKGDAAVRWIAETIGGDR